jgi:methionyl-tRNA synthetase
VDAFLNYLTGLGWNGNEKNLPEFWPIDINLIGKDILRVHATIWPAILLHLGIKLPNVLYTHGHILSNGKKMSKTLGNTISIDDMLEKFGTDGTRYLLLSAGVFGHDIDVTMERMVEKYNADLANGLGNLVSRVVKLYEKTNKNFEKFSDYKEVLADSYYGWLEKEQWMENMRIDGVLDFCISNVKILNKNIEDNKPWELLKSDFQKFEEVMNGLIKSLSAIAIILKPFMPETSEKIKKALETKEPMILFGRIR